MSLMIDLKTIKTIIDKETNFVLESDCNGYLEGFNGIDPGCEIRIVQGVDSIRCIDFWDEKTQTKLTTRVKPINECMTLDEVLAWVRATHWYGIHKKQAVKPNSFIDQLKAGFP